MRGFLPPQRRLFDSEPQGQELFSRCRLDAWLNCTVEKEQCVSVPAGTYASCFAKSSSFDVCGFPCVGITAAASHKAKDVKKFYAEQVPTKLKDFDVRKLDGKWCHRRSFRAGNSLLPDTHAAKKGSCCSDPRFKVRGYNKKYDCYPCQTNTFKYNASDNTVETEVSLRLALLGCTTVTFPGFHDKPRRPNANRQG